LLTNVHPNTVDTTDAREVKSNRIRRTDAKSARQRVVAFDLRSALIKITPLISYSVAPSVTAAELTRVHDFFDEFVADRPDRIPKLWGYLLGILAIDKAGIAAALEQQRRGDLAERASGRWMIDSQTILRGVEIGVLAASAPGHLLAEHDEHWPGVRGANRQTLSMALFAAKLVRDDQIVRGSTELELWQLARIVGAACQQEVLDRLARHPTSSDVYGWLIGDPEAIAALLSRVRQQAERVQHRPNQRFLRKGKEGPPSDDEKESLLREMTAVTVAKGVERNIRQWYPNGALDASTYTLLLAMDGLLGHVPNEARNALIDHLRGEAAAMRGGKVTSYATIDNHGAVELRAAESGEPRSAAWGADVGGKDQPRGSVVEHATREVSQQMIEAIERHRTTSEATASEARQTLGPAMALLNFYLDHDGAPGWDDAAIARELGISERTVGRYRAALRLKRTETVLLVKTYDQ
jgi:hypothetical protein